MNRIIDNAAIFLKPTLAEVYDALYDTPIADQSLVRRFIVLSPNEHYAQMTNYGGDINMAGDAEVHLVDKCGNVVANITDRVIISQFNHSETGYFQMRWEVINVGQTFNIPVHFRFRQVTNPSNVFYSNPVHFSSDLKDTFRVDYSGSGVLYGFDYTIEPKLFQSCRFKGHYTKPTPLTDRQMYLTGDETTIQKGATRNYSYQYSIEYTTNHEFLALDAILLHPIVYITDGDRNYGIRTTASTISNEDVLGTTNYYKAKFDAYRRNTDTKTVPLQLAPDFDVLLVSPQGIYTLSGLPGVIVIEFNLPIVIGSGTITVVDTADNSVLAVYSGGQITPYSNNGLQVTSFSGLITENGIYNVILSNNFVTSIYGQSQPENVDFTFEVRNGDWLTGDWNDLDFFTNI